MRKNRNSIRIGLGTLYAAAILVAIFVGHHSVLWVAIIGGVLLGLVYRFTSGPQPGVEGGRNRNRNRNRDRS